MSRAHERRRERLNEGKEQRPIKRSREEGGGFREGNLDGQSSKTTEYGPKA